MKLKVGNVFWTVHFHHQEVKDHPLWDIVTSCRIHSGTCHRVGENDGCTRAGFLGVAKCSHKDVYNRSAGNKIAFASALKSSGMESEDRRLFWLEYWLVGMPAVDKLEPGEALTLMNSHMKDRWESAKSRPIRRRNGSKH